MTKIPTRFTEADQAMIVNEYKQGTSRLVLAKRYTTKPAMITRILDAHNVEIRPPWHHKVSVDMHPSIAKEYAAGVSITDLANKHGVASATVRKILARNNVKINRRGNKVRQLTDGQVETIKTMIAAKQSQVKIAQYLQVSQAVVSRIMREHNLQPAFPRNTSGEFHHSWQGGRTIAEGGYIRVLHPVDGPLATMRNATGYILEHRLVMAQALGRPLYEWETVHHINGNSGDNRLENLQLRIGKHGKGVAYRCSECGSTHIEPYDLD